MKRYLWQNPGWQDFQAHYDQGALISLLSRARFLQGELLGKIASLDLQPRMETQGEILIAETVETSKIEGVELNIESVRSSVAERLGLPSDLWPGGTGAKNDRHIAGVVEVLIDAVRNHGGPLNLDRLNRWHGALFPLGLSGLQRIRAGEIRSGEMKVVSGYLGAETVHFEAPPPEQARDEIFRFIAWFNASLGNEDGLLRAAGAHLKFVTIHPYDDGNGRLSRALTDMAMAQDENTLFRSYSLSAEIMKERASYYQILADVQNQRAELIEWYKWFLSMFINAVENSRQLIADAFYKAAFWSRIKTIPVNERQRKVIQKMLDTGIRGFAGGITTRKYVSMTKTSAATAYRELDDMNRKGILRQFGAGRSVRYELDTGALDPI
jgi:Fic family protein